MTRKKKRFEDLFREEYYDNGRYTETHYYCKELNSQDHVSLYSYREDAFEMGLREIKARYRDPVWLLTKVFEWGGWEW